MKKNFFAFAAAIIAVVLSSFTVRFNTTFYEDYDGSGAHDDKANYVEGQTPLSRPGGTASLDWISIESADASIAVAEFNKAFDALDTDLDNSLNDETEGIKTFKYPLPTSPSFNAELEKQ